MKIEVWSDFACPFCYIGKTRFEQALQKFPHRDQVEVVYKAYQLNPNAPTVMKGSPEEAFAKGHRMSVEKAKERFKMFVDNAKTVGLEYRYDIIQMTNTFDAHRLAKYADTLGKENEITNRFMKAYFTEGYNLADGETLVKLAEEVGLDPAKVRKIVKSNKYKDVVEHQIQEGRSIGVQGVPFFVLGRKYGISGAQQEDYFAQALNQLWNENQELKPIEGASEGPTCDDEGCTI